MLIRLPLRWAQYTPNSTHAASICFRIYDVKGTWKVSFWLEAHQKWPVIHVPPAVFRDPWPVTRENPRPEGFRDP